MSCGTCSACMIERTGCGCDNAENLSCFYCNPSKTRPACKPLTNAEKVDAYPTILDALTHAQRRGTAFLTQRRVVDAKLAAVLAFARDFTKEGILAACVLCEGDGSRYVKVMASKTKSTIMQRVTCEDCQGIGLHPALTRFAERITEIVS